MSEMIDRVREAITVSLATQGGSVTDAVARAAINAMAEPSTAMCTAYERSMKEYIGKLPSSVRSRHRLAPYGYLVPEPVKIKIRYAAMIKEAAR